MFVLVWHLNVWWRFKNPSVRFSLRLKLFYTEPFRPKQSRFQLCKRLCWWHHAYPAVVASVSSCTSCKVYVLHRTGSKIVENRPTRPVWTLHVLVCNFSHSHFKLLNVSTTHTPGFCGGVSLSWRLICEVILPFLLVLFFWGYFACLVRCGCLSGSAVPADNRINVIPPRRGRIGTAPPPLHPHGVPASSCSW